MHSYAPDYEPWGAYECILLPDRNRSELYFNTLIALQAANVRTKVFQVCPSLCRPPLTVGRMQGAGNNDIQNEAYHDHGIPSMLVEFNEGVSEQRLAELARVISSVL